MVATIVTGVRGGKLSKSREQLIDKISAFVIDEYKLSRFKAVVSIKQHLSRKLMDDWAVGYASMDIIPTDNGKIKWATIDLVNQNKRDFIKTLLHEWCHVKQYLRGEMSLDGRKWKSKDVSKLSYSKQPCEKEAYREQERLYKKLVDLKII